MRIVFIQPNVGFKGHTWEALGIGYLSAYLKEKYRGELDIDFFSGFYDDDATIIKAGQQADIIGFGCTSPQFKHGLKLAKEIKNGKNTIVFGGIHPTVLPDQVLKEGCIDAVAVGEGENAILQLVQDVATGAKVRKRRYHADYIAGLDALPSPDRKTIKNERNIRQAFNDEGIRITSVLSSRGCPFQCSFCCSNSLWGSKTRFRSTANVLDEVDDVVRNWKIEFLKFADDTFTVNKKRVIDFCQQKMERGIGVPYGANAHINTMDEEVMSYLVKSGCRELWFGVESGSPKILKDMHKNTEIGKVKKAFQLCRKLGIKTRAYFLLGMPNETMEDIGMTEKLCDELQPDVVGFTLLSPYPINEYFDNTLMADWDWSTFDEYNNDWVRTKTLSNRELKDIQRRLVAKYQQHAAFRQRKKSASSEV